ncbi:TonB-dependent receptor, partial [Phocaeicola vulgatus]
DDLILNEHWKINAGLHFSFFNVQKQTYLSLQSRLSISFQATSNIILKSSFSQMSQCTQLLSTASLAMPSDLWVPVTRHIRPMKSFQYAVGVYYTGIKNWEFSIEGYYKDMYNVLEYKDGESFLGSSHNWEDKVEMGKGRSFGVEFMAQKTAGLLTGWINYTLSKSDRQFSTDGINNGKHFPYQYDRRHTLNLTLNYQLTRRIDFNMSWTYASGCMATLPTEKTHTELPPANVPPSWIMDNLNKGDMDHYSSRNNYRLPASHQLNIGFNFHKQTRHGERIWNISILNAYNAMNPNFVYISREAQTGKPILKKMTILPCIPSFSYTYKF